MAQSSSRGLIIRPVKWSGRGHQSSGTIGSAIFALQFFSGAFAYPLEQLLGYRPIIIIVTLMASVGLFLSALVNSMVWLYVTLCLLFGSSGGICFHAVMCVLLQHFPHKNGDRATAIAFLGTTIGNLLNIQFVKVTLLYFGWRISFAILGGLILFPGLIFACFIIPIKSAKLEKQVNNSSAFKQLSQNPNEESVVELVTYTIPDPPSNVHNKLGKLKRSEKYRPDTKAYCYYVDEQKGDGVAGVHDSNCLSKFWNSDGMRLWRNLMGKLDTWVFAICTLVMSGVWCLYFVNISSYFDSIGMSLENTALLITLMIVGEIAGKVFYIMFGWMLTISKICQLAASCLLTALLSILIICPLPFYLMVFLSLVIGVMRAIGMVLPYIAGVDVVGTQFTSQLITLTVICQGVGFITGGIIAGAIYDATGSYDIAFFGVAGLLCLSFCMLLFLACRESSKSKSDFEDEVGRIKKFSQASIQTTFSEVGDEV